MAFVNVWPNPPGSRVAKPNGSYYSPGESVDYVRAVVRAVAAGDLLLTDPSVGSTVASVAVDCAGGASLFDLILTQDVVIQAPTNASSDINRIGITVKQDATANRRVFFASAYKFLSPISNSDSRQDATLVFEFTKVGGQWIQAGQPMGWSVPAAVVTAPGTTGSLAPNRTNLLPSTVANATNAAFAASAGRLSGLTTAEVVALGAWPVGAVYNTTGRFSANDGGAMSLTVVGGSLTVNNVLTYAYAGGVSLVRRIDGSPITAASCGMIADGSTGNRAALQNIIDVLGEQPGAVLELAPIGTLGTLSYVIEGKVYWNPRAGGMTMQASAGCGAGNSVVNFVWRGPATQAMFQFSALGCRWRGFNIVVSTGYTLRQAVDFCNTTAKGGLVCSRSSFEHMYVRSLGSGVLTSGWTTNHDALSPPGGTVAGVDYDVAGGNCEDMVFTGVNISGFVHSAFRQSYSQPFNWVWRDCLIVQNGLPTQSRGVAHFCDIASASGTSYNCFYYNIEVCVYAGGSSFAVVEPSSELVKKWYYAVYSTYAPTISFSGGRHASDGYSRASAGPFVFSSSDNYFFDVGNHATMRISNMSHSLGSESLGQINMSYGASLYADTCLLPNRLWIHKGPDPSDGTVRGGVYSRANKAVSPSGYPTPYVELPDLRGALNGSDTIQATGAPTTIHVELPLADTDSRYVVNVSTRTLSGTYSGNARAINQTITGFDILLSAAPSSATIVLGYDISYPPSAQQRIARVGATDFTTTGELRTSSGGGPNLQTNGFVHELFIMLKALPSSGSGADNSCVYAKGYSYTVGGYDLGFVYVAGSFRWIFRVGNNTSSDLSSPSITSPVVNKWLHMVIRYDAADLTMWINGVKVATLTTAVVPNSGEFSIGTNLTYPSVLNDKHVVIYAVGASDNVPTDAQIVARYGAVRTAEIIPTTWTGMVQTHRYVVDGRSTVTNDASGGADPITLVTGTGPSYTATAGAFY